MWTKGRIFPPPVPAMKTPFLAIVPAACALLGACSHTTGITPVQVAAMNRPAEDMPSRVTLTMTVKERGKPAQTLPARQLAVGRSVQMAAEREFIYPSAYQSPVASPDGATITPATPVDFITKQVGIRADLTTEKRGGLVIVSGEIRVTDFQGFTDMGGQLGQPILDAKGRLITENKVQMPRFATYTTPVHTALRPDGSATIGISHAKRGTTVTLSLAPAR